MAVLPELFHFTCDHSRAGINLSGRLVPMRSPLTGGLGLVWLTDLPTPNRDALGLSSVLLTCDRTQFRYVVVDAIDVVPWMEYRRQAPHGLVSVLESVPGVRPRHWFVSEVDVPVRYAPLQEVWQV